MNDLLGILASEDIAAGDQDIGTGCNQSWGGLVLYTTVNLYEGFRTTFINEFAQTLHLLDGVLDELLTTEAWVNTHQQHHIDIANDILEKRNR